MRLRTLLSSLLGGTLGLLLYGMGYSIATWQFWAVWCVYGASLTLIAWIATNSKRPACGCALCLKNQREWSSYRPPGLGSSQQ